MRGGYDDNVTTVSVGAKQPSAFSTIALQLAYGMKSPRTQVSLQAGATGTYYWDHPQVGGPGPTQDYDVNINFGLSIRHQASARLTFTADLSGAYVTEPQFADRIGGVYRNGNFFYAQDKLSAAYLWTSRFQTISSYRFFSLNYDESSIGLYEDRFEHTFGDEFKFIWTANTALVAEYRLGLVHYSNEGAVLQRQIYISPVDFRFHFYDVLLDRDSMSHIVLAGFDHTFNPRLLVSLRGGAEFRDYVDSTQPYVFEDPVPPPQVSRRYIIAPYVEATLNYAVGKTSALTWSNRYGLEEPDAGSGSDVIRNAVREGFYTNIQASHAFSDKMSASAGISYYHDNYHDEPSHVVVGIFGQPVFVPGAPGFTEDVVDFSGRVSYQVTRHCSIDVGYEYTVLDSDSFYIDFFSHPPRKVYFRDYDRNRFSGGLTYNF